MRYKLYSYNITHILLIIKDQILIYINPKIENIIANILLNKSFASLN